MGILSDLFRPKPAVLPMHIGSAEAFTLEVLKSDRPVILDVWSDNCAPCRQLGPVLTAVATHYDGRIKVAEVNTAAPGNLMRRLGVQATPTILVFHRGREIGRVVGYHPRSWFDEMIATEFPEATGSVP